MEDPKKYSYDLTQKLTFFVIGIELIFCGYILLNADKFNSLSWLFLLSGSAALSGIIWRFFYNQTFHNKAHGKASKKIGRLLYIIQIAIYWIFISLTVLFLVSAIIVGYFYLQKIENKLSSKAVSSNCVTSSAKENITDKEIGNIGNKQQDITVKKNIKRETDTK